MRNEMRQFFTKKWQSLIQSVGTRESSNHILEEFIALYSTTNRHYHNLDHIYDCLRQLQQYPGEIQNRHAFEFAIWFHDIIYETNKNDNEAQSARWAKTKMEKLSISPEIIADTQKLIQATDHQHNHNSGDALIIQDIDLSTLGAATDKYNIYSHSIRLEYKQYPDEAYKLGRMKVLESFLKRKTIYQTEYYRSRYENKARVNLEDELNALNNI